MVDDAPDGVAFCFVCRLFDDAGSAGIRLRYIFLGAAE